MTFFLPIKAFKAFSFKSVKRRQVDLYLLKLYQEAAGMLPTKLPGSMSHSKYVCNDASLFSLFAFPRLQRGNSKRGGAKENLQIVFAEESSQRSDDEDEVSSNST